MLCQACGKNEASVLVTQISGGHVEEKYLCAECAATVETGLGELFAGLIGAQKPADGKNICTQCGISLEEVRKSGRLGCPACYDTFCAQLAPLLRRVQNGDGHKGRRPPFGRTEEVPQDAPQDARAGMLAQKRARLAAAVAEEEFELAAELRDEIRALEKEEKTDAEMA